jgi:hypothetical protein
MGLSSGASVHLGLKIQSAQEKIIGLVKVQWTCYNPKDSTWEHEEAMWEEYPQSFTSLKKVECALYISVQRIHFGS